MIRVPFPIGIGGDLEDAVCIWVGETCGAAILGEHADVVEFEDEELALLFRLKFGL